MLTTNIGVSPFLNPQKRSQVSYAYCHHSPPTFFFNSRTSLTVSPRAAHTLPSYSLVSVLLSIKSLTGETTEINRKAFTKRELIEGLDAHADELADLVEEEVDLDEVEEDSSRE